MDERMRFVIRLKDGEGMACLCREFGISRKTGYKIFGRYEECGLEGLTDLTRRPFRYGNQLPEQIESAILRARREKPHWGARKIRERLLRALPHGVKVPAASTIHAVLDRHGLVTRPLRSRTRTEGTPLSEGLKPNDLWCTDYKGEFMLADRRYCYPLTVTDHASRFLLLCEAMESHAEKPAFTAFDGCSRSVVCRGRFAPTTAFRSLLPMDYSTCPSSRSGGFAWASALSASNLVIRSRMAGMSGCI
jgi:transposase InsO family protein